MTNQFKPGDHVLAKFGSFSFWPAVLVAHCHAPPHIRQACLKERRTDSNIAYVYFVDDGSYGYVTLDLVKPVTAEEIEAGCATRGKKQAAFVALKEYPGYWELLKEKGLVSKAADPYDLSSLYAQPPGHTETLIPQKIIPQETKYKPGDRALIRFKSFPYWPGVLISRRHVPQNVLEDCFGLYDTLDGMCFAFFPDDDTWAYSRMDKLKPLDAEQIERGCKEHGSKRRAFEKVRACTDYWSFVVEKGIVKEGAERFPLVALEEEMKLPSSPKRSRPVILQPHQSPVQQQHQQEHPPMTSYKPGDLVQAKTEQYPLWPGVIVARCHVPRSVRERCVKAKGSDKDMGYVYFPDDGDWGYAPFSKISPLPRERLEKLSRSHNKKGPREKAYQALLEFEGYWDLLLELGMVDKDTRRYELKGLEDTPPVTDNMKRPVASEEQNGKRRKVEEKEEEEVSFIDEPPETSTTTGATDAALTGLLAQLVAGFREQVRAIVREELALMKDQLKLEILEEL